MIIREKNPHGGQIYDKNILLDFSVNVNPNGTPDSVIEAAISGVMQSSSYPDAFCKTLLYVQMEVQNLYSRLWRL